MTGAANIDLADVAARVKHVRGFAKLPVGVGFGIRDAADRARAIGAVADAVVIGSALIQEIEKVAARTRVTRERITGSSLAPAIRAERACDRSWHVKEAAS